MRLELELYVKWQNDIYPWFHTTVREKQMQKDNNIPLQFEIANPPEKSTIILQLRKPLHKLGRII